MNKKIFIGVAWPYANGNLHLGHVAGCYLPADIFARFNRLKNNDVLMVSGSDEHGTPITITAERENTSPQVIADRYHRLHSENMKQLGISFDLFTRTTKKNHEQVVQSVFKTLYEKNYIFKKSVDSFYCEQCKRFLPDRYVEGTCPKCGYEHARGDQCDECGAIHEAHELVDVKCKICGNKPELKKTEHFFFALSKFKTKLLNWLKDKNYWRSSVLKFTRNWLRQGLKDRAITRDISWGVKIPFEGFEDKRIYVWFDAVIGYLSASKEWSEKNGRGDKWVEWWKNKESKHYYFLAKDNIPFHSIIWPSILMGYDENLNLPYDIPANEYLRLDGEQFSKSKGLAIWVPDILKKFDVDTIRYYLSINMPEKKDCNWSWSDFVKKNNDELVGTYGNFIHRVLTFAYNNFERIPEKTDLDDADREAVKKIKQVHEEASEHIQKCEFKKGLKTIMGLAHFGNVYFNDKKPWMLIKNNREKCATAINICIQIVKALAVFTAPYLPFSADNIWKKLGYKNSVHEVNWDDALSEIKTGHRLEKPLPLFKKLQLEDIMTKKIDDFSKLDLRVGKILDVKDHPNADKLYILNVNLGETGERVLVAGMKPYYSKEEIRDKKIVVVINLKPATIRGIKSNGMLLAAQDEKDVVSLLTPENAEPGCKVYVDGITSQPVETLEFEDFKKIELKINEKQQAVYKDKKLRTKQGLIITDKKVQSGATIS